LEKKKEKKRKKKSPEVLKTDMKQHYTVPFSLCKFNSKETQLLSFVKGYLLEFSPLLDTRPK
jgi:hypothetical protein